MKDLEKYIRDEIITLFKLILESEHGINEKVGRNTLAYSNLHDEANIQSDKIEDYNLFYNDYLEYVENGRKPFAKKVPLPALIQWARRKNIPDDSSTIYAIRESIFQKGIKARPILQYFEQELDDLWKNDLSDRIFDTLTKKLDKYFN